MQLRTVLRLLVVAATGLFSLCAWSAELAPKSGQAEFRPAQNEAGVPKQFQLAAHAFKFELTPLETSSDAFSMATLTFPSPVVTPEVNNNTVHCEYFCPKSEGKHPGVIVLHILGGDFDLARLFCRSLASHGTSALFLKMPYYGPRRQPDSPKRMVSNDPRETVQGMTQAVLDIRQATAWLGGQEEIDGKQLGIMGISLGGITSALAVTAEPRLQKACLLLAGGDIGQVAWESPHMAKVRERWLAEGGTKESLMELMKTVDPVTYGDNVRGKKILMLNARNDEVIPPTCTKSLWRAFGQPEIIWWDAGHYTSVRYIFQGLDKTTRFFEKD